MKPPVLLMYNLQGETAGKIRLSAMRYKIRLQPVDIKDYNQPLAALCGQEEPVAEKYEGQGFKEQMIVMAHFPAGLTSQFLNSFRQMNIPSIGLKAVLTPTNSRWDSISLYEELSKERKAMAKGLKAHNQINPKDVTDE